MALPKKGKSGIDDNSLAAATTLHYLLLQCIAKFHISYDPSNLCMISQLFSLSSTHLTYAPENVDTSATYRHELSSKVKNLITFILPVFIAPMAFFFFLCNTPVRRAHSVPIWASALQQVQLWQRWAIRWESVIWDWWQCWSINQPEHYILVDVGNICKITLTWSIITSIASNTQAAHLVVLRAVKCHCLKNVTAFVDRGSTSFDMLRTYEITKKWFQN